MDLLTGPAHDIDHELHAKGAYEWWYIDSLSDDGEWGVVVILFRGMPMSPQYLRRQDQVPSTKYQVPSTKYQGPGENCGYAVSVYHRGKRIAFAFRGVPEERMHVPGTVWEIDTAHEHQRESIRVRIEHDAVAMPSTGTRSNPHAWVLVAPRLNANVHIELLDRGVVMAEASWSGLAYRDHNFGQSPLQADFKDWYWGRVQGADHSLVFLHTLRSRHNALYVAEVREGESEVRTFSDAEVHFRKPRITLLGLRTHRVVQIMATDAEGKRRSIVCSNRHIVEDGPFYQRYISEWWLDDEYIGIGTSEYMDASRLSRGWIRPFLRLPWFQESR